MNIGKVVLVPFPFDDYKSLKVRPALYLTEPRGEFRQIVIAYIGTKIPENLLDTDMVINPDDPDLLRTGLHQTSVIRILRLITISVHSIRSQIDRISEAQWAVIRDKITVLFQKNTI